MLEMTPRSLFYLIYFQKQGKSETGSWPSISKVIRQGHVNNFIFIEFSDLENVRNDTKITSLFHLHPEKRTNRDFDMVQWRHAWRHARDQPIFIRMLSTRTKIVLWTLTFKLTPKTKLLHQFEMTDRSGTGLPAIHFGSVFTVLLVIHSIYYTWADLLGFRPTHLQWTHLSFMHIPYRFMLTDYNVLDCMEGRPWCLYVKTKRA